MKKVGKHPNVVNILGCCTIRQPLFMIMEYIGCGDLVNIYLINYFISNNSFINLFSQLQYLRTIRAKHEERSNMFNGMSRPPIVMDSCSSIHNSNMSNYMMGKYLDLVHSSYVYCLIYFYESILLEIFF